MNVHPHRTLLSCNVCATTHPRASPPRGRWRRRQQRAGNDGGGSHNGARPDNDRRSPAASPHATAIVGAGTLRGKGRAFLTQPPGAARCRVERRAVPRGVRAAARRSFCHENIVPQVRAGRRARGPPGRRRGRRRASRNGKKAAGRPRRSTSPPLPAFPSRRGSRGSWRRGSSSFCPTVARCVSERPGRIRLIVDGRLVEQPYATFEVGRSSEGGLLGLALHPRFPDEPYVYAMYTYQEGSDLFNRVVRIRHNGDTGEVDRVIVDGIPGGRVHHGGRIAFGPDGMLYVRCGETWRRWLAQDLGSLGGKILRIAPDGFALPTTPSPARPFGRTGTETPRASRGRLTARSTRASTARAASGRASRATTR